MAFTANDVRDLRVRTGAGMMDCKNALVETNGDVEKAIEYLREKGIAKAAKRSGRIASQGIVDSYIHMGGKIGVLLEINCETDFVAKGDMFKDLSHDLTLQIAAAKALYIAREDVPPEEIEHEKNIREGRAQMKYSNVFKNLPRYGNQFDLKFNASVIASGGVGSLDDLKNLKKLAKSNITGVINNILCCSKIYELI